jgi:hypothetical protein
MGEAEPHRVRDVLRTGRILQKVRQNISSIPGLDIRQYIITRRQYIPPPCKTCMAINYPILKFKHR